MSTSARHDKELQIKAAKALKVSTDPIEILRARCLQRGATGIKGLARYVS